MDNSQISYREILLASGISTLIEKESADAIELIETIIPITDGVTLSVGNGYAADLFFGKSEHIAFNLNEETAAAFVNIDAIKPVEFLMTLAEHSGVHV